MLKARPLIWILILVWIGVTIAADGAPEDGLASWYGYPYHGRRAANGEIYDMEKLTAAHRTLPFGTRVRVVNLRNRKSVDVRINDRGPFVDGRIIDVSLAAARAIDLVDPGITPVRLEVIDAPIVPHGSRFGVQVGAFRILDNARRCAASMQERYGAAKLALRDGDPGLWRVVVGAENTEESARILAVRVRRESGEAAFVVRLDE